LSTLYGEINVKKILAVINATYAVAKRKPEKNQACRDSKPDLCDTGALITARTFFTFISSFRSSNI